MGDGKRARPLPWLRTQSQKALASVWRDELVKFADSMTPNGAYYASRDLVYVESGNRQMADGLARACRFLAIIRRDHGKDAFDMVVSQNPNNAHA